MDQLFWPFLIYAFLSCFMIGGGGGASPPPPPCFLVDSCSNEYRMQMASNRIKDAEPSVEYCNILVAYQTCIASASVKCRGNILYHSTERATKTLATNYCPLDGKPLPPPPDGLNASDTTATTADEPLILPTAGCRYNGRNVFRHCGVFGDPHLKTFGSKYQTCRLHGEWYLINNPFMSVILTSEFVDEARVATAPTKIVIVIKSRSTPCTLEQRYEASSSDGSLPSTFVDGTDRPGADETVSLRFQRDERLNYETVEIRMKYVATRLLVRRVGRYLAFSAQLPEEVLASSATYDQAGPAVELCSAGCPADELLRNVQTRRYPPAARSRRPSPKIDREAALSQCRRVAYPDYDYDYDFNSDSAFEYALHRNNLTGSFLEWCVFDLMTSGPSSDLVKVARVAQADARTMDPSSARDDAGTPVWPSDDGQSETHSSTTTATATAAATAAAVASTPITTSTSLRELLLLPAIVAALYATS